MVRRIMTNKDRIVLFLHKNGASLRKEIADGIGSSGNAVGTYIKPLQEEGIVTKVAYGRYALTGAGGQHAESLKERYDTGKPTEKQQDQKEKRKTVGFTKTMLLVAELAKLQEKYGEEALEEAYKYFSLISKKRMREKQ